LPLIEKPIPSTGERLPVVGLGTNGFNPRAPGDLARLRSVLEAVPRLGGRVIDTAAIYGRSESIIGATLQRSGIRHEVFLSTKVMARSRAAGIASIEHSFKALRTPRIDLLEVHNLFDMDQIVPLLEGLKKERRVRYIGITAFRREQYDRMAAAMRKYPLDFIQVDYSIGDRGAEERILPLAAQRGIAVLADRPFGGLRGGGASAAFARVAGRPLPSWTRELQVASWGQLLLKYVVSHPAVNCAIPGTTEVRHLADNLAAAHGRLLDPGERRRVERLWASLG
ncbi:MAG: aldo/keto reductase, partial [Steroidobacteraceae bacterium]